MADYLDYIDSETGSFRTDDSQLTLEWLAVLSAKAIPFELSKEGTIWTIRVEQGDFPLALAEVDAYEKERDYYLENADKGVDNRDDLRLERSDLTLLFCIALLLFFLRWGNSSPEKMVFSRGTMDSVAVINGEWWRIVTALTLHADLLHVLGNVLFLVLFASPLCQIFGGGVAWTLILSAAAIGNGLTAWYYFPVPHLSIGASTAVFAALGILGAHRLAEKWRTKKLSVYSNLPLIFALAVFAWTGMYGSIDTYTQAANRNVGYYAHMMGFCMGLVWGGIAFWLRLAKLKEKRVVQLALSLLVVSIVLLAWFYALNAIPKM